MRRLWKNLIRSQQGGLLIEAVIAVLILGMVGTSVLTGLSTAMRSSGKTEIQSKVENIARSQMEYMFSLPYLDPPSAYPTVSVPQGYEVTCQAQEYVAGDTNIARVVVTVSVGGTPQLILETLRAK